MGCIIHPKNGIALRTMMISHEIGVPYLLTNPYSFQQFQICELSVLPSFAVSSSQDLEHAMEGLKREMAQEPQTVMATAQAQEGVGEGESHEERKYIFRYIP